MKSLFSLLLVLLAAGLATFLSGCGGGGAGGSNDPALVADPFSRNAGPAGQAQDLAMAIDNVDAPAGKDFLLLISAEGSVYYLNALDVPVDTAGFYPLAEGTTFSRGQSGGKSSLLAKNELAISGLARALAGGASGRTRDTTPIDFTGDNGIHWIGSYATSDSGGTTTATLNVTGTRDELTMTIAIESNDDSTLTDTSSMTDYTFSYSFQVTGTVPGAIGNDAVDLTATGEGDGNDVINFVSLSGSGHQLEETTYRIAMNNRVIYRSTTSLNHSYLTTSGSSSANTSYDTDAWLFSAVDGYWVHATTTSNLNGSNYTFALDAVASDGYTLTFDGTTGTLTDDADAVLATLSYDEETGITKVDFTPAVEAQGAPDYLEIDLYTL